MALDLSCGCWEHGVTMTSGSCVVFVHTYCQVVFFVVITAFYVICLLQCEYCNWGHLDKVDQLDYRKITIHSKKVGCGPISSLLKQNNKFST